MRRALAALLVLTVMAPAGSGCRKRKKAPPVVKPGEEPPVKILYPTAPGSFVKLLAKLEPSVVHLSAAAPVKGGPADWFPSGDPGAGALLGGHTERMRRSLGSGFLIDNEGSVLTNAHLVAQASTIRVQLHDGSTHEAKLVGQDAKSDVALLRFEPAAGAKLRPARLGKSSQLEVGEWVVAVGNPFGLGPSLSAGVVSARERADLPPNAQGYWGYIQTDLAIHAGNSGGPVVNVLGEVVGIATAVELQTHGLGFVSPIDVVQKVLPMLRREGKVVRAWVGIYMDRVTEAKAKQLGLKQARGALITSVIPRGPADRAGLRAGDVILTFDGKKIMTHSELPWLASLAGIDRLVAVQVWRGGKLLDFTLKSERMPE